MPDEPAARQAVIGGLGAAPRRTRAEQLATDLDARIRSLGLRAGDPVGTLDSLREETGYAYSTVSEAVRILRDRGALQIRPGRGGGLFVAERGPVVRLRHTLLDVQDEPETVADAIELRDHLEVLVDVGAARCRTDADVTDLRTLLEGMRAAPDWDAFIRANWALHERIVAICPNRMAAAVYTGTLGHLNSSTSSRLDDDAEASQRYRAERCGAHEDLVDAIAAGDEAAVRAAVARHNTPL
ncbi:FadR/GntR family transcriptional regulator [Streptomyces sp. NPDC002795]|uniref:FadR/GntR family transcriptional regulator n=1 Tax=Streptomyces sp. NPDC002795 TaxID=3364665 RepID=UPI00368E7A14